MPSWDPYVCVPFFGPSLKGNPKNKAFQQALGHLEADEAVPGGVDVLWTGRSFRTV